MVEKQEEGSSTWEKVTGIGSGTTMPVKGLKEGKKYKLRVKAENIYGAGEPLETSKSTLAKNPFVKIFLFLISLNTHSLADGQKIYFHNFMHLMSFSASFGDAF